MLMSALGRLKRTMAGADRITRPCAQLAHLHFMRRREDIPSLAVTVTLTVAVLTSLLQEFVDAGVKYEKIAIPGRKVPTMDIIKK